MKKTTIQSLLLGLLMTAGASSAWAAAGDVTTNADIDFSNAITDGAVAGTVNSMTIGTGGADNYIADGWLRLGDNTSTITIPKAEYAGTRDVVEVSFKMAWGNKNNMGSGFRFVDSAGEYIGTFQFARWDSNGSNSNTLGINMNGLLGSAYNNAPILDRATTFSITIDYASKTITSVVSCPNPNATKTFTVSFGANNPLAKVEFFAYGVGGNTDRTSALDNVKITTTEGNYDVQSAQYTVNFIDDKGNNIKTEERTGDVGSAIVLMGSDTEDQKFDDVKYIYLENDAEGQTIASDGSTVVSIKFRKAEEWKYSIKAMVGDEELAVLSTGTVLEGDAVSYGYSQYIAKDGVLYKSNAQSSNPWWGGSFTPTVDNEIATINYTEEGTTDVVFCEEGENISTLTAVTGGNTDIRASNRAGGYAASDAVITTLPAGKYKVVGATYGNAGTTFTVKAGEQTVLTLATNGNPVRTEGEEFILAEETDIVVPAAGNAGSSPKVIDYLYIIKTGEVEIASFTIKYETADGKELKESVVRGGVAGEPIVLRDSDKEAIWVSETFEHEDGEPYTVDTKYIYVSDDAEGKTATEGTVVTVIFREAGYVDFTIVAVDAEGTSIATLLRSSVLEGEIIRTTFSKYIQDAEGKWYETPAPYAIDATDGENTITYTPATEDFDYFFEAEHLKATRSAAASESGTGLSNCYAFGLAANEALYTRNAVSAGVYTLSVAAKSRRSGTTNIKINLRDANGNEIETGQVLTYSNTGTENINWTIEGIEIPEGMSLSLREATGSNSVTNLDYITLKKTDDFNGKVAYYGDANGDGDVDISDVVAVVNYILNGGATGAFVLENANVNGDEGVDISDVVGVVNMILNGEKKPRAVVAE